MGSRIPNLDYELRDLSKNVLYEQMILYICSGFVILHLSWLYMYVCRILCAGKVSCFVTGFTVEWLCRIAVLMTNRKPSCEKKIVFLTLLTSLFRWRLLVWFLIYVLFISQQKHICKTLFCPELLESSCD